MDNPRKYISYSQLISFESGRYYQEYILGNKRESAEMDFGKKIAEGLENESDDEDIEFLRMWMLTPDKREKELLETIEGIPIKVKMDGWDDSGVITEYKTGKVKWTQSRVDKSDQLTIYSMVVWHKYHINPKITLSWFPTMNNGEEIVLTGEIPISFNTTRTVGDYGSILKRLKKAYSEINKMYKDI